MLESSHESARHSSLTSRQIFILAIILIVGAFIRFYQISGPSLWMDEIVSIELAMGHGTAHDFFSDAVIRNDQPDPLALASAAPWWDIWNRVEITTHPPLYFVLLRGWIDLLGTSPGATRCLSAILSLAGIVVFFDVCRLLHGPRVGLFAACMMALAIGQIDIAQEARSYPLLILLGMGCCDVLVRIVFFGAKFRRLILLVFMLVGMLLTHYFAAGAFAAMGIYAFIRLRGRDRRRTLAAIFAAAAIAAGAWGYQLYWQMRTLPNFDPSYVRDSRSNHAIHVLLRIVELPLKYCCGELSAERLPLIAHVIAAAIVVALMFRLRRRPDLLLWILWARESFYALPPSTWRTSPSPCNSPVTQYWPAPLFMRSSRAFIGRDSNIFLICSHLGSSRHWPSRPDSGRNRGFPPNRIFIVFPRSSIPTRPQTNCWSSTTTVNGFLRAFGTSATSIIHLNRIIRG